MPHTRSAKKNLRKSEKRRLRNRATMRSIKEQIKSLLDAVRGGNREEIQKQYNLTAKKLDKAAAKRILHPNTAARRKSRLARIIRAKEATAPAAPPAAPTA